MTPLAIPYFVPPTVPDTWVPWPLQSFVPWPSLIAVYPVGLTRPVKSWCEARMPVSTMYAVTPAPVVGYV